MPYKDKTKHNEAMRLIQTENRELAHQMKIFLGIPLDRRRKKRQ